MGFGAVEHRLDRGFQHRGKLLGPHAIGHRCVIEHECVAAVIGQITPEHELLEYAARTELGVPLVNGDGAGERRPSLEEPLAAPCR